MSDAAHTIAAILRLELPKLVPRLARVVRDVGRAEELAQDAMVIALERWPADGVRASRCVQGPTTLRQQRAAGPSRTRPAGPDWRSAPRNAARRVTWLSDDTTLCVPLDGTPVTVT